ncbi:MAG: YcxB family protein [Eubacteriales bacterium]
MEEKCKDTAAQDTPLYRSETTFSYDEFRRMTLAMQQRRRPYWTFMVCFELVMLVFCVGYFLQGKTMMGVSFLILAVLFPLGMYASLRQSTHSAYKKMAARMEGVTTEFVFYRDYFTAENKYGRSRVLYRELKDVIFTRSNTYLMVDKTKAYILDTDHCSEDLTAFIARTADRVMPRKTRKPRATDFLN